MNKIILALVFSSLLLLSGAQAQIGGLSFPGPGPRLSTAPTGCGVGVIDLSTGCVQPMLGGL